MQMCIETVVMSRAPLFGFGQARINVIKHPQLDRRCSCSGWCNTHLYVKLPLAEQDRSKLFVFGGCADGCEGT